MRPNERKKKSFKNVTAHNEDGSRVSYPKNGVVSNCAIVNVREAPTTKSKSLELLWSGENVTVIDEFTDFYFVKTKNNHMGYISSKFLKLMED